MEGLSHQRPRPAQDHEPRRRRVHPSLSPARAAERLPPHPPTQGAKPLFSSVFTKEQAKQPTSEPTSVSSAPARPPKPSVADAGERVNRRVFWRELFRPAGSSHARAGASSPWARASASADAVHSTCMPRLSLGGRPNARHPTIAVRFKPMTPARSRRSTKRLATIADMSLSALWASLRPPLTGCDGST